MRRFSHVSGLGSAARFCLSAPHEYSGPNQQPSRRHPVTRPDEQDLALTGAAMTRRALLRASGAAAIAGAGFVPGAGPAVAASDSLAELIERRRLMLIGSRSAAGIPQLATQLEYVRWAAAGSWKTMIKTAGRTTLWSDTPLTGIGTSATATGNLALQFNRLRALTLGYSVPGNSLYGNADLVADIVSGLRFLNDTAYKTGMTPAGNWWFWEIGIPRNVVDILVLLHAEVPGQLRSALLAAVRWFSPDPNTRGRSAPFAETGANRVDKALICCMLGILDSNAADIARGRDALSDSADGGRWSVFAYVSKGDGFYADGSFVQHSYLPYGGSYGLVALAGIAEIIAMLRGTSWAVTDPARSVLLDAVEKTYAPFVWDGRIMDTVRGRAVSRQNEQDYVAGFSLISSLLLLAPGCEDPYRSRFLSLAKGWLQRCTDQTLVGHPTQTVAKSLLALDVLGDATVQAASAPSYTWMFADQDRLVHQRPGWGFTASISSSRIGRYEWGNNENKLGWYQGDGMVFLYTRQDAAQFSANFWPTVDPYRLPGTTVNNETRAIGAKPSGTEIPRAFQAFAGGVAMDRRWGVLGMDHLNHNKSLSAVKSWFLLDDAVVCLGAGITGTGGSAVETTVENRSFAAGVAPALYTDSTKRLLAPGAAPVPARHSVHVDGHGGYVFLAAEGVSGEPEVSVVRRTGKWNDINTGTDTAGAADSLSRDYVTVTHKHGVNPSDAGYAYMMLPTAPLSKTLAQSETPDVQVLANTKACQMIEVKKYGVVLANFFTAGSRTVPAKGVYASSGPCTLAVKETDTALSFVVSDPSRTQTSVRVTLPGTKWRRVQKADSGTTLVSVNPLVVEIQLDGRGHQKYMILAQ
jgi:hyaluronate lyase